MTYVETYHGGQFSSLTVPTEHLSSALAAIRAAGAIVTRSFPVK